MKGLSNREETVMGQLAPRESFMMTYVAAAQHTMFSFIPEIITIRKIFTCDVLHSVDHGYGLFLGTQE
jgi:hypothetical protein